MMLSLWVASTGMMAEQRDVDVIANNLANVNTVGFKRSRINFEDLIYQTIRMPGVVTTQGTEVPTGIQYGHGVKPVSVQKIFMQGDLKYTENPLDLAIEGDGFFQILLPTGETAYTRAGSFKLNSSGQVVTPDGYPLQPPITIPPDTVQITVEPDGTVSVIQAGSTTPTQVGSIQLVHFPNPSGLKSIGKNLFLETDASGAPITGTPGENGLGTIAQGFLEMSNVRVVEEMVNMIAAQRAYEASSKTIITSDQMLGTAVNIKR